MSVLLIPFRYQLPLGAAAPDFTLTLGQTSHAMSARQLTGDQGRQHRPQAHSMFSRLESPLASEALLVYTMRAGALAFSRSSSSRVR